MMAFEELYEFLYKKCFGNRLPAKTVVLEIYGVLMINSLALINGLSEIGQGLYLDASILDHSCTPSALYYVSNGSNELVIR